MRLIHLDVRNLRIVQAAALAPAPGINMVIGDNGSGKSSLLEAIHLLGTGRSFRSRSADSLIRLNQSSVIVHARLQEDDGRELSVGVEKQPHSTRIHLSETRIRNAASLARRVPVVLVPSDSQRLLSDGAELRRRLLDWGLFHVEPTYAEIYQGYRRVLQQRNAQLRDSASAGALAPWDRELQQLGHRLHGLRQVHLNGMLPNIARLLSNLLSIEVSIHYHQGWREKLELEQALRENLARDQARGHTTVGPHRADLGFTVAGDSAQHRLSRGEAKLFCLGIWLAQARDFHNRSGRLPLILIDDLAAELDSDNQACVFRALADLGAQAFVTAVSKIALPGVDSRQKSFHVERGSVTEMV